MRKEKLNDRRGFLCSSGDAGSEQAVASLIAEFTGKAEPLARTPEEQEASYLQVIEPLMAASAWPGVEGSPKSLLEDIIVRAGRPGAGAQREPLARALVAYLGKNPALNETVFALRQLAVIGQAEAVSALADRLRSSNEVIREYALRALEANTAPEAGAAILAALKDARRARWRVALINALGHRGDTQAVPALTAILSERGQEVVRASLLALGAIATPDAAATIAGTDVPTACATDREQARLLCADGLLDAGDSESSFSIYREVHDGSRQPLLRLAGLRGMVRTNPGIGVTHLLETIKRSDDAVQAQAARLVLELPDEALPAVRSALPGLPASAQSVLSAALAERDSGP